MEFIILNEINSTQEYLKKEKKDNILAIAKKQTNGYGVTGKWESNNNNLYMSYKKKGTYLWVRAILISKLFTPTFCYLLRMFTLRIDQ